MKGPQQMGTNDMDRAIRMQELHLKRKEKDTYKERRKEGRSNHGVTSLSNLLLATLCWFLQGAAIAMPQWRAAWVGVMGYPRARSWGLFTVSGQLTLYHHQMSAKTCSAYGQLNVFGACLSPICRWYKEKCQAYIDLMLWNYGIASFFILEFLVHTCCIVWTAKFTPRTIRWASNWWFAVLVLHWTAVPVYFVITGQIFEDLDSRSYYPVPGIGFSFWFTCVAGVGLTVCCYLGKMLANWWPEEVDSDEEDEDDSDEDAGKRKKEAQPRAEQQPGGYDPAQGYPQQPGAYDPSYGYGQPSGYPPQPGGYDQSYGYGQPAGYPQPGGYEQPGGYDGGYSQPVQGMTVDAPSPGEDAWKAELAKTKGMPALPGQS